MQALPSMDLRSTFDGVNNAIDSSGQKPHEPVTAKSKVITVGSPVYFTGGGRFEGAQKLPNGTVLRLGAKGIVHSLKGAKAELGCTFGTAKVSLDRADVRPDPPPPTQVARCYGAPVPGLRKDAASARCAQQTEAMQLTVRSIAGEIFAFMPNACSNWTRSDILKRLECQKRFTKGHFVSNLVCGSHVLSGSFSLKDCGVQPNLGGNVDIVAVITANNDLPFTFWEALEAWEATQIDVGVLQPAHITGFISFMEKADYPMPWHTLGTIEALCIVLGIKPYPEGFPQKCKGGRDGRKIESYLGRMIAMQGQRFTGFWIALTTELLLPTQQCKLVKTLQNFKPEKRGTKEALQDLSPYADVLSQSGESERPPESDRTLHVKVHAWLFALHRYCQAVEASV